MRISVQELKDYIRCPLYYKFVHMNKLPETKDINYYYNERIKLCLSFYYFSLIDRKVKSFESILRKWESVWFGNDMCELFNKDTLNTKSNEAVMLLTKVYKRIIKEKITPVAVNFNYEVIFPGEENIHVTGEIDLIRIINDRTRKKQTQLLFLCMSRYYPDSFMIKSNLFFSLASYAFRDSFKEKEDSIIIDSVYGKEDVLTTRTGGDFSRARKSVENICRGIKNNVFYPTSNKIACSNCAFKLFCINEKSLS